MKRKGGLMKKAYELSVLCDCEVALIIFDSNGKHYQYSSKKIGAILERFVDAGPAQETQTNETIEKGIKMKAPEVCVSTSHTPYLCSFSQQAAGPQPQVGPAMHPEQPAESAPAPLAPRRPGDLRVFIPTSASQAKEFPTGTRPRDASMFSFNPALFTPSMMEGLPNLSLFPNSPMPQMFSMPPQSPAGSILHNKAGSLIMSNTQQARLQQQQMNPMFSLDRQVPALTFAPLTFPLPTTSPF